MIPTYFVQPQPFIYYNPYFHQSSLSDSRFLIFSNPLTTLPTPQAMPQAESPTLADFHSSPSVAVVQEERRNEVKIKRKREKNPEKELVSAKKNSESNIICHFFSYFVTQPSSINCINKIVTSLGFVEAKKDTIVNCFGKAVQLINLKRTRKYINKAILASYFQVEGLKRLIPDFLQKLETLDICSVDDLAKLLRTSFYYFLKSVCLCSLLTSKRISLLSKQVHLKKRRKMQKFLDNGECNQ